MILVVDDDLEDRLLVCAVLKRDGFEVASATSDEVLERILACKPDLILLGPALPAEDGKPITHLLRAHPRTERVPIVALTGRPGVVVVVGAEPFRGYSGQIAKPIDTRTLTEQVRTYLDPPLL
jgi:CheY-like chemotaxis protein